ncbi:predicted protein [Naegleria gruberi]|uniref:Predicted protein n=1 Tax=Naegleria gruberi TaxID=5762 RepID=D2W2V5_NAEGR|nr:uncharacterized protein NAEGRDRAFT_75726 [Naegleria gruberi]EFC36582.1 predicted protein [Naegleria gruberi]|eukprot:XP_002669326.1 predicted protein [Naegleria gruberi strain NEG-M]
MTGNQGPPFDRSQDPQNGLIYPTFFWCHYCQENPSGSGWRYSYEMTNFVFHDDSFTTILITDVVNVQRPRITCKGDLIGLEQTYNVDLSFASHGTDVSDISECCNVWFGYPHNSLFEHAVDGNLTALKKCLENTNNSHDINEKLQFGDEWTPLHGAVVYNQLEIVEHLLKHGADYTITDKRGRSCLTLARILNFTQCVTMLKKYVSSDYLQNQYQNELAENERQLAQTRSELITSYGMNA